MGVIAVLAVLAILAGVITPMYFRQLMAARERATVTELQEIEAGLVAFFEDVGRFPTDAEGLAALVSDPGLALWQGPYLNLEHEEPTAQVSTDAWNLGYLYDRDPVTVPADAAEALVVSGGRNRLIETGAVGGSWTLNGTDDDLQAVISAVQSNRENTAVATTEMERLGAAAQAYFRDHEAYPTDLRQLDDAYLDGGLGADTWKDQWNRIYVLNPDNAATPATLTITSYGPDGVSGGGDDVDLALDSVLPGRKTSYFELAISQAAVAAQTSTALTGDWTVDRVSFDLAEMLEADGWGRPYEEKMSTRTILSGGPDADYFTPDDNIPPGIVPDDVVPVAGDIVYEEGTAETEGEHCSRVSFDVTNITSEAITINSMALTWVGPTAWYKKAEVDDEDEIEQDKPQLGSGDSGHFDNSVTLAAGETITIEIESFVDQHWEGGDGVDMSGTDMTVTFSDGSSTTFNTGSCSSSEEDD